MPLSTAGEIIVRGIEQRKRRVLVGRDAVGVSLLARLAPVSFWTVMAKELPE